MISTTRILGAFVALTILLAQPAPVALAQGAPFCAPGTRPQFTHGFAALKAALGPVMGEPVECEHNDGDSGDIVQQTTTGLAFWRRSTNTPTFTDGYRHWALLSQGLVAWEGSSIDPPPNARGATPHALVWHAWDRQQRSNRGGCDPGDHVRASADPQRVRLPHHGPAALRQRLAVSDPEPELWP
jgi:hypothetical protein